MFLSLRYSTMISFILSTTYSVTEIPTRRDSAKRQLLRLYSQFSFTKILKALQVFIFTAFWRYVPRPIKIVPYRRRQTKVTETPSRRYFEHIFQNAFLYCCFFNIDYRPTYRYVGKHAEGNIKKQLLYLHKIFERRPKDA